MSKPNANNKHIAWLGIDVAKETFVAALDLPWVPGTEQTSLERLPAKSFFRTEKGTRACIEWAYEQLEQAGYDPADVTLRAAMESTGKYSLDLFGWLVDNKPELRPAILNPHQTKHYLESRSVRRKDDFIDARGIARFGMERSPAAAEPPTGARFGLRETLRVRKKLVERRDATKNEIGELPADQCKEVRRILECTLRQIERAIEKCEKQASRLLKKEKQLAADAKKLKEIFGVGELTAMVIVAEIGDLRRFESSKQLACYCGLTPRVRESGKYKGQARVSKFGNDHVRKALYMPAIVIARYTDKCDLSSWYHRKIGEGMHLMKARLSLMRKLLEKMWHVVVKDLKYENFPQAKAEKG